MTVSHDNPQVRLRKFEGPLDLLFHLIEKNDIDIYDIPISEVTDQYMDYLDKMSSLDMDVASEFLLMAATLVHIKSRMLLPDRHLSDETPEADPREELVLRLLEYRRCKMLASDLKDRYRDYSKCMYRLPQTPSDLGIDVEYRPAPIDRSALDKGVEDVCKRNEIRFADIASKITHILKRDKFSIRDKIRFVWDRLIKKGKIFFHELFPVHQVEKMDRIVGFLAVLELLRGDQIKAEQEHPFDVILIEPKTDKLNEERFGLDRAEENKELAAYD
ncbi:MAG: segregation/condensation protein A [Clostridiales bacterium]|nr:segregation/condensation protein A [Clostridiales bacterium]